MRKVLLIYSGLLLLANVATSIFFGYLFGGSTLFELPFQLLFTWIAAYKGVQALREVKGASKVLGSPFWQGAVIVLISGALGATVVYLVTKGFSGQGVLFVLLGGFAGRRAASSGKRSSGKLLTVIGGIVLGIFTIGTLLVVGNAIVYRLRDVTTEARANYVSYTDEKFGYSFQYPNTWKKSGYPLAQGRVDIHSTKDPQTTMHFWYKDSGPVGNIDELVTFVEDDAKYGEEEQGAKTISIEKTQIDGKEVVLWTARYNDIYSKVYYFPDYTPIEGQLIHIWIAVVNTTGKDVPDEKEEVENILASYNIIEP